MFRLCFSYVFRMKRKIFFIPTNLVRENEGEDLMQHLTRMTSLAEQIEKWIKNFVEEMFNGRVRSLPESYDNFGQG